MANLKHDALWMWLKMGDGQDARKVQVHVNEREIIIGEQAGWLLDSNDENHNCDFMGCGQQCVMLRLTKVREGEDG